MFLKVWRCALPAMMEPATAATACHTYKCKTIACAQPWPAHFKVEVSHLTTADLDAGPGNSLGLAQQLLWFRRQRCVQPLGATSG